MLSEKGKKFPNCIVRKEEMTVNKMNTEILIQKAKMGNADAFTELMKLQMQTMYRTAKAILMNDEDAADAIPAEIIQFGLYDIGAIDCNESYSCDLIHVCETMDGQFYIKAVFRKTIDGIPVTAWHNFGTITGKGSPFPIKIWGSLFSEEEIGIDQPVLPAGEAVAAMQQQIDQIPIQEEPLTITKISLEYLSVISSDGELLIVPVWRFWAGENEKAQSLRSEEIIAVNALNGELIWEKREAFAE